MNCNKKNDFTRFPEEVFQIPLLNRLNKARTRKLIEKKLLKDYHFT